MEPGDTYFLARSNIIGGTCLTTVFGMGTGMARPLLSPGMLAGTAAIRQPAMEER